MGLETLDEEEDDRLEHIRMYGYASIISVGTSANDFTVSRQEGREHQRRSVHRMVRQNPGAFRWILTSRLQKTRRERDRSRHGNRWMGLYGILHSCRIIGVLGKIWEYICLDHVSRIPKEYPHKHQRFADHKICVHSGLSSSGIFVRPSPNCMATAE